MLRTRWGLPARLPVLAALLGLAAACATQPAVDTAAGVSGNGPAVLTGATLLTEGEAPRLLLSGSGRLSPTVFSRDGHLKIVIDLPDTVVSAGLEPPRADGTVLSKVEMRSFTELGKPHVQFELTTRAAVDPRIGNEPGSTAMAIVLDRTTAVASSLPPAPEPPAEAKVPGAPAVTAEALPTSSGTSAPKSAPEFSAPPAAVTASTSAPPATDEPPVPVKHAANGKPATRLAAVGLKPGTGGTTVTLAGDGSFAYETFRLENPPRFVIDLPGVVNGAGKKVQNVHSAVLMRVRVSQFRGGPDPVTRVVFDLGSVAEDPSIAPAASGLRVTFPVAAPREAAQPVAAPPSPSPAPVQGAGVPAAASYEKHEIEDPSEKIVPPSAPAALATKVAPEPEAAAPAAAPASEPETSAARVVAAPETVAVVGAPPAPGREAPEPPADPVPAPPPASVPAPVITAPAPATGEEAAPQLVPSSPEVREVQVVPPPASPAPAKKRATAEDKALIEAAEALLNQQDSANRGKELQSAFETKTLGAGEKQYTGEPITLNLKDADIKDTLQRFSELTQLNIVLDPDVRGTVTVSLQDIPWDQALELILKINGLGYVLEGNVMRIASTAKLAQEEAGRLAFLRAQDQNRPLKTVLQRVSYANADSVATVARKVMSSRGDIFVDARSNTLVIKELPDYLPTVLDLIKNLDVANPQVMIETRIIEATRTFSQDLGIVWGFQANSDAAHGNTTGLVFPNNGSLTGLVALPSGAPAVLSLAAGNILDTFKLNAEIHAAEARGLVKVISTPKVQTQTGEQASIQSGFQIPVQTTVNNTTTVLYINATLRLDVTPHITTEGTIIMDVTVQKREPAVGINISGGQNIPLTTRDAKTRLMVRDGGTAVIGGIFKLTTNDGQSMIPGLWKLPILGNLFRSRTKREDTDELMIFITPRIMR
jgi:type IV pilus assembly protein PilQ